MTMTRDFRCCRHFDIPLCGVLARSEPEGVRAASARARGESAAAVAPARPGRRSPLRVRRWRQNGSWYVCLHYILCSTFCYYNKLKV